MSYVLAGTITRDSAAGLNIRYSALRSRKYASTAGFVDQKPSGYRAGVMELAP